MAITTLENTKWTFKNTLPFASYAGTYNIIFSNDSKSCTSLELTSNKILYHYNGGTLIAYQDGSWVNEKRKTIYIADGADVTNSTLIGFITNCATQQELPTYGIYNRNKVVELAKAFRAKTGTTALLNHTKMIDVVNNINLQKEELEVTYNLDFTNGNMVNTAPTGKAFSKVTIVKPSTLIPSNILSPVEIAGVQGSIETYATPEALGKVYKFNISPTIPNTAKTYIYNFKSNGTQYTYLAMGNNIITYANSGGEDIVYNNGWTNEEYRTLCFEEVPQGELLTMLNSNAIRQNGELYFTENGETTLATQGKYLDGNLKVIVNVKQLDTSDANATSSDIRYTKSAYVNGTKVEGSIQDYANETTNLFSITANLTNVSATIPQYIEENETITLAITADSGYALPDSISVSGCTYTYNKDSGEISLSGASSDVVIGVVGVEEVTYTWKCTINNLGSSSTSNVTFNHEGTMPTFEEVTFNGDVFIKIPTMYGKVNTVVSNQITSFTIANGKVDDSFLPFPVFVKEDGTSIMSYVLMGKYINNSTTTVQSIPNTKPSKLQIDNARTIVRTRGNGYQLFDWMFQRLWQYLIICAMNTINTNSGSGLQTDGLGIYWGASGIWIDGICHNSGVLAVSYKPSKYVNSATASTDGYTSISYNLATPTPSDQCISKLGYDPNNPFVNYPSASVKNSSFNTYYCDYYYYSSGSRPFCSIVGDTSARYGAFLCDGYDAWTYTFGVRLCYRPVDE